MATAAPANDLITAVITITVSYFLLERRQPRTICDQYIDELPENG
jgi:hypothetical protein